MPDTDFFQRLGGENIALQAVCAVLLAEVARLHNPNAPRDKVREMAAGLQGVALGVVAGTAANTPATRAMTEVIERVTMMADKALT